MLGRISAFVVPQSSLHVLYEPLLKSQYLQSRQVLASAMSALSCLKKGTVAIQLIVS